MPKNVDERAYEKFDQSGGGFLAPFRLEPFYSPRPWGTRDLRPWVDSDNLPEPIGELWFTGDESRIATGEFAGQTLATVLTNKTAAILGNHHWGRAEFPLLIKLLFPRQKLSVQVHPDDSFAQGRGHGRGKTECWYVLDAEPAAGIALGFRGKPSFNEITAAVKEQTLENLLNWIPVAPGDMIFVDAGTVHAIGPGSVFLEVQQQSDLTYRMYDYGRPRELHLELALEAMRLETAAGKVRAAQVGSHTELISTRYFRVDQIMTGADERAGEEFQKPGIAQVVFIAGGEGVIEAAGCENVPLKQGQLAVIPASSPAWGLRSDVQVRALIASAPAAQ